MAGRALPTVPDDTPAPEPNAYPSWLHGEMSEEDAGRLVMRPPSSSYQKKEPLLKDTLTGRVTLPPLPMLERWIAPPGFSLHEPLLALC